MLGLGMTVTIFSVTVCKESSNFGNVQVLAVVL